MNSTGINISQALASSRIYFKDILDQNDMIDFVS